MEDTTINNLEERLARMEAALKETENKLKKAQRADDYRQIMNAIAAHS